MTEELSLPCHYKVYIDTVSRSYYFNTDTGAHYEILFTDGKPLFSSTEIKDLEVSNIVINKTRQGTGIKDPQISLTIEAIIQHFFADQDRVLIYTCDSVDSKHLLRYRMFNTWFEQSRFKSQVIKLDFKFENASPMYFTSMIFHKRNRLGIDIITKSFKEITDILSDEK